MVKTITQRAKKTVLVNPTRTKRPSRPSGASRRRNNPGLLAAIGALNPQGAKPAMKAKAKKKQHHTAKRRPVKKNPFVASQKSKRIAKRTTTKRNPTRRSAARSAISKPMDMLKMAAWAALGLFVTRQAPQIALGARNTGIIGYIANGLTAAAAGVVASRTMGPAAGNFTLAGGSLYLLTRIAQDYTPLGKMINLSGVGDANAAGHMGSLGAIIQRGYFAHPVISRGGQPVIPGAMVERMKQLVPAAAAPAASPAGSVGRYRR